METFLSGPWLAIRVSCLHLGHLGHFHEACLCEATRPSCHVPQATYGIFSLGEVTPDVSLWETSPVEYLCEEIYPFAHRPRGALQVTFLPCP